MRNMVEIAGRRPLSLLLTSGVALGWGLLAGRWAVANHRHFSTSLYDLAIYDNVLWRTVHGHLLGSSIIPGGSHAGTHFDPVLILLAPLYALAPQAETLLVFQALWLASGAIPLFLLGRRVLRDEPAALFLATALLAHPSLHGPTFYDFHSVSLAGPLFLWLLFFLESGRDRWYVAAFALLLITREDMALLVIPVGLYAWTGGRPGLGRLTVAGAFLWLALVKLGLALWAGGGDDFAWYYRDLVEKPDGTLGDLVVSVVTRPDRAVRHILGAPRLAYLGLMFGPLLFLPFLARRGRYLMAYGLMATLLASRGAMHSVHFQYTTLIYPFAFALSATAVTRLVARPDRRRLLAGAVLVLSLAAGLRFGALAPNDSFRAGYADFRPRSDASLAAQYQDLVLLRAMIPGESSVAASWHVAPHVSNRRTIVEFPDSFTDQEWVIVRTEDFAASRRRGELESGLQKLRASGAYAMVGQGAGGLSVWRRLD